MKGEIMKSAKLVGIVAMLAGLCLSSRAVMLPPGGSGLDAPQAPGSVILDTLSTPYSFGGISGTITSWVVRDPANPLGGLSFYYQIVETGTEAVGRVATSNFGVVPGSPVDVATITAPFDGGATGGVSPVTATRSAGAGSVVGFNFVGNEVQPGQSSVVMVVNTAYQAFQVSAGAVIDSSAVNVAILGPVPEPSTAIAGGLLLLPFGASALRIVRKR
jgi:hypothetical protein